MKYLLDNGKKINAWYGIVENNYGLYEDKVQYCKKYNTHVWFTTFFDEHKAQRTREEAKSGRWSTSSNDCPLDLFNGLDSATAIFLPENFRIFCAMLYRNSSEVIEGVDEILL